MPAYSVVCVGLPSLLTPSRPQPYVRSLRTFSPSGGHLLRAEWRVLTTDCFLLRRRWLLLVLGLRIGLLHFFAFVGNRRARSETFVVRVLHGFANLDVLIGEMQS